MLPIIPLFMRFFQYRSRLDEVRYMDEVSLHLNQDMNFFRQFTSFIMSHFPDVFGLFRLFFPFLV